MKKHVVASLLIALGAAAFVSSPAAAEDSDLLQPPPPWQEFAMRRSIGVASLLSGVDEDISPARYAPAGAAAKWGVSLSSYSAAAPSAPSVDDLTVNEKYTVSQGALSVGNVYVYGIGRLEVNGTGSITSMGNVNVDADASLWVRGSGSFTTTGTFTLGGFQEGEFGIATGYLDGNGAISAASINFDGLSGFSQFGGTVTTGQFKMGGIHAEYQLHGGTFSTASERLGPFEGFGTPGTAEFSQSGGMHTVTGNVEIGYAHSRYTLGGGTYSIGGTLTIDREVDETSHLPGGVFELSGGTLRASSITGRGTLNLEGGTLQAGANGALLSLKRVYVGQGGAVIDTNGFNVTTAAYDNTGVHSALASGVSADGGLRKIGAGMLTLTGANTYNGATTVSAGTLQLARTGGPALNNTSAIVVKNNGTLLFGGNNQVNQAPITLGSAGEGAGTPAKIDAGGFSQGTGGIPAVPNSGSVALGALTLVSNAILDMTGTSVLHFANSSAASWGTATLSVYNWSGMLGTGGGLEQLLFGGDLTGLNAGQLLQVSFYSDSGDNMLSNTALILGSGEIIPGAMTPVPEPGTWAAGVLAILAVAYSQRRRFRSAPSGGDLIA